MVRRINFVNFFTFLSNLVDDSLNASYSSMNSLIEFYLIISIISLCVALFL